MKLQRVISPQSIACNHQLPRDLKCNFGNSIWLEYSLTSIHFKNVLYKHSNCRNLLMYNVVPMFPCILGVLCPRAIYSLTSRGLRARFNPRMIRPAVSFLLWIRTKLKTSLLWPECAVTKPASDTGSRTYIFNKVLFPLFKICPSRHRKANAHFRRQECNGRDSVGKSTFWHFH